MIPPSWLRRIAALVVLLSAVVSGVLLGLEVALLVLSGGFLLLVINLLWSSLLALTGESELSFEEALSLAAPSAEEEQKLSVLRALKDLEYERSVGKISAEDYAELSLQYRAKAKAYIARVDESLAPARARAEALLAERLRKQRQDSKPSNKKRKKRNKPAVDSASSSEAVPSPEAVPSSEAVPSPEAVPSSESAPKAEAPEKALEPSSENGSNPAESAEPPAQKALEANPKAEGKSKPSLTKQRQSQRKCEHCSTSNDLDARFCKGCGKALADDQQALCPNCPARYPQSYAECPDCGAHAEAS